MGEISQDTAALLPSGDYERLDKHEREEFHALQERMAAYLIQQCNHFQVQFPTLHIEFRFQAEVYQNAQSRPATVRYSGRVY